MVYSVENFADVDADGCSMQRRFTLVEAVGDASDSGKEGSYAGVGRVETVLGGGGREGVIRGKMSRSRTLETGQRREIGW